MMYGTTYYQGNRKELLNRAKKYHYDNKEVLREKARNKSLSEDYQKNKKIKKENMEVIDIIICRKDKQKVKEYTKIDLESKK